MREYKVITLDFEVSARQEQADKIKAMVEDGWDVMYIQQEGDEETVYHLVREIITGNGENKDEEISKLRREIRENNREIVELKAEIEGITRNEINILNQKLREIREIVGD